MESIGGVPGDAEPTAKASAVQSSIVIIGLPIYAYSEIWREVAVIPETCRRDTVVSAQCRVVTKCVGGGHLDRIPFGLSIGQATASVYVSHRTRIGKIGSGIRAGPRHSSHGNGLRWREKAYRVLAIAAHALDVPGPPLAGLA